MAGVSGLKRLGYVAVGKVIADRFLAGLVGNSSLMSGGLKIVGGMAVQQMLRGREFDYIGDGIALDGIEDLITAVLSGKLGFGGASRMEVI